MGDLEICTCALTLAAIWILGANARLAIMPESCPSHVRTREYFALLRQVVFKVSIWNYKKTGGNAFPIAGLRIQCPKGVQVQVLFPAPTQIQNSSSHQH
jgi:hypothetical protein